MFEVHLIYTVFMGCLSCCLEVADCHNADRIFNFFILMLVVTAKVWTSQILG
jgi:hypothetical protein